MNRYTDRRGRHVPKHLARHHCVAQPKGLGKRRGLSTAHQAQPNSAEPRRTRLAGSGAGNSWVADFPTEVSLGVAIQICSRTRLILSALCWRCGLSNRPCFPVPISSGLGIRGETRELCLQTRHDEVHEGANLRNEKPPLRRDDMDGKGVCSCETQQDPKPAVAYMLDDLIGALCGGRPTELSRLGLEGNPGSGRPGVSVKRRPSWGIWSPRGVK